MGDSVVHLRSRFPEGTEDTEWFRQLGQEGNWVVISGDPAILETPHERKAWLDSGLTAFFLTRGWMDLKPLGQAALLLRWWPVISAQAKLITSGAGFMVNCSAPGKLRQVR